MLKNAHELLFDNDFYVSLSLKFGNQATIESILIFFACRTLDEFPSSTILDRNEVESFGH